MTNPRTYTAIIGITEQLAANHIRWREIEAALTPTLLNAAVASGSHTPGHISDPTGTHATRLTPTNNDVIDSWADAETALNTVLKTLRAVQARQTRALKQHPELAGDADATARAIRCDGSIDPLCTRNAVKGGICWACTKRRQRQNDDTGGQVHQNLVRIATVDPRPETEAAPRHVATITCHTCGWWTRAQGDNDAELHTDLTAALAEHTAEAHPDRG